MKIQIHAFFDSKAVPHWELTTIRHGKYVDCHVLVKKVMLGGNVCY